MFTSCHMQEDRNMISSNINSYHDIIGGGLMIFHIIGNKEDWDELLFLNIFYSSLFRICNMLNVCIIRIYHTPIYFVGVITIRIFKSKNMH